MVSLSALIVANMAALPSTLAALNELVGGGHRWVEVVLQDLSRYVFSQVVHAALAQTVLEIAAGGCRDAPSREFGGIWVSFYSEFLVQ